MNVTTPQPEKNVPSNKPWLLCLVLLLVSFRINAQVVADGATNTLSNTTNTFTGDVTVGTNGSFTSLVLSDNALLTHSAHGVIGLNFTARSNEVRLINASAHWTSAQAASQAQSSPPAVFTPTIGPNGHILPIS